MQAQTNHQHDKQTQQPTDMNYGQKWHNEHEGKQTKQHDRKEANERLTYPEYGSRLYSRWLTMISPKRKQEVMAEEDDKKKQEPIHQRTEQ